MSCDLAHERAEQRYVVTVLGLDELSTGRDLLGESARAPIERQRGRILGCAEKHARRCEILRPDWNFRSSRRPRAMPSSDMQSRSNTGLDCG